MSACLMQKGSARSSVNKSRYNTMLQKLDNAFLVYDRLISKPKSVDDKAKGKTELPNSLDIPVSTSTSKDASYLQHSLLEVNVLPVLNQLFVFVPMSGGMNSLSGYILFLKLAIFSYKKLTAIQINNLYLILGKRLSRHRRSSTTDYLPQSSPPHQTSALFHS